VARKPWESLDPAYRRRLERGGITPQAYTAGESLKAARGHKTTPERPERAFRNPDLYGQYLRRRVAKGKPVPDRIIGGGPGSPIRHRIIGDSIGWAGRDTTYVAVITRSSGGGARGEPGTITIIKANPRTGEWDFVETRSYDQSQFVTVARDLKDKGYQIQVTSVPSMGVTA